jgi:hypothetical protein
MTSALVIHPSVVQRRAGDAAGRHPTAIGDGIVGMKGPRWLLAEDAVGIDLGANRRRGSCRRAAAAAATGEEARDLDQFLSAGEDTDHFANSTLINSRTSRPVT